MVGCSSTVSLADSFDAYFANSNVSCAFYFISCYLQDNVLDIRLQNEGV
jgi:hypothetical protein